MKIWHDDIRRPPDATWVWARDNDTVKDILLRSGVEPDLESLDGQSGWTNWVTAINLDHDLGLHDEDPDAPGADLRIGQGAETGLGLLYWMIDNNLVPTRVTIHSMNPVGADNMRKALINACEGGSVDRHITLRVEPYRPKRTT